MNKWEKVFGTVFAAIAILIAGWMIGDYFCLDKDSWPGWVQAIGSIAAIIGAYFVGERQAEATLSSALKMQTLAAAKQREAYFAIAAAACDYCKKVSRHFSSDWVNKIGITLDYDEQIGRSLIDAMAAVPIHELGSSETVRSWIDTRTALVYFQNAMTNYMAHINEDFSRKPESVPGTRSRVIQSGQHVEICFTRLINLIPFENERAFVLPRRRGKQEAGTKR